tara:strand:+ start:211 stop:747 length:537 start_codon:yes stop_codon:yes gene_type:complete
MNRYQFEDLISEYIENQLSLSKRKEFEAYLKKNPDSEELVYSIKDNIKKLNKMPQLTTSSTFNERLMESVGKSNYNPNEDKLNKIIFGFTPAYASLMMGLVVAFIFISVQLINPSSDPQQFQSEYLTDEQSPRNVSNSNNIDNNQNQDLVEAIDDSIKADSSIQIKRDFSNKIQFVND